VSQKRRMVMIVVMSMSVRFMGLGKRFGGCHDDFKGPWTEGKGGQPSLTNKLYRKSPRAHDHPAASNRHWERNDGLRRRARTRSPSGTVSPTGSARRKPRRGIQNQAAGVRTSIRDRSPRASAGIGKGRRASVAGGAGRHGVPAGGASDTVSRDRSPGRDCVRRPLAARMVGAASGQCLADGAFPEDWWFPSAGRTRARFLGVGTGWVTASFRGLGRAG